LVDADVLKLALVNDLLGHCHTFLVGPKMVCDGRRRPKYAWRKAESSLVMNFTIEFFRTRPSDEAHATLDRISIVADNLDAATVKAKSLFDTLDMPQKPDGLRILDQVKRELFVWKPNDHDA
jgi:hypothetical protein